MNNRFLNLSSFDKPYVEYCLASHARVGMNLRLFVVVEGNVATYKTEFNRKTIYEGDSARDAAIAFNDELERPKP